MCSRQESNLHFQLRRPATYPLIDESSWRIVSRKTRKREVFLLYDIVIQKYFCHAEFISASGRSRNKFGMTDQNCLGTTIQPFSNLTIVFLAILIIPSP